jgi:hypothetical protein
MRHPLIAMASALALSLTLVACGGDDDAIVGAWRALPNAFDDEPPSVADRQHWEFKDDGTITARDSDETVTGTYTLEGDRLRLVITEDGDTSTIESMVVVTGDRLMFGALTPEGAVDGAVGRWSGYLSIDGSAVELTMDLRADRTGDFTQVEGTAAPETYTGTWEEQGEALRYSFEPEPNFTVNYQLFRVGEEGIGGPLFERI